MEQSDTGSTHRGHPPDTNKNTAQPLYMYEQHTLDVLMLVHTAPRRSVVVHADHNHLAAAAQATLVLQWSAN